MERIREHADLDDKLPQCVLFLANFELQDGIVGPAIEVLERFVDMKCSSGWGGDAECVRAMQTLAKMDRAKDGREVVGHPKKQAKKRAAGKEGGTNKISLSLPGAAKVRSSVRDMGIGLPNAMTAAHDLMSSLRSISTASSSTSSIHSSKR